ncbi:hypothetical protein FACS189444_4090 [Spirochaetia bacterium]|nr:hypothetical protein FACS189444_4090 [Spirochaetia bacterium]
MNHVLKQGDTLSINCAPLRCNACGLFVVEGQDADHNEYRVCLVNRLGDILKKGYRQETEDERLLRVKCRMALIYQEFKHNGMNAGTAVDELIQLNYDVAESCDLVGNWSEEKPEWVPIERDGGWWYEDNGYLRGPFINKEKCEDAIAHLRGDWTSHGIPHEATDEYWSGRMELKTFTCDVYYVKTITLEAENEEDAEARCRKHEEFKEFNDMDVSEIQVSEVEYDEHQCHQCGVITDHIVNDEPCCPDCEKELLEEVNA